jgi:hypothetical protein
MLSAESVGQPAKFSLSYDRDSPHAPSYYAYRLTGAFDHPQRGVTILYEETSGQQTARWSTTLLDQEYEQCLAALAHTTLQPLMRVGGGYQLKLTDAHGETLEGEPLNDAVWAELAGQILQRHGPAAKKRQALRWVLACALYIGFQLLLILIWLICFLAGIGGLLIHLLLVLALLLALIGAVAGVLVTLRKARSEKQAGGRKDEG